MFSKKKEKRYITIYERDIKYGTYRLDIYDSNKELMQRLEYITSKEFFDTLHELYQNYSVEIKQVIDSNPYNYTQESKSIKDILTIKKYTLEDCFKEMEDIIKPVESKIFMLNQKIIALNDGLKIYAKTDYDKLIRDYKYYLRIEHNYNYREDDRYRFEEYRGDREAHTIMAKLNEINTNQEEINSLKKSIKWVSEFYYKVKNSIRRNNLTPEELFIEDKDLQGLVDHFMLLSTAEDQIEKTKRLEYWLAKYKEVNNEK